MVFIVTGRINNGKTNKLLSIYRQIGKGDGFYSRKVSNHLGDTVGYDLIRLSNEERAPFIFLSAEVPSGWAEAFQFDKFSFSSVGLDFANGVIDSLIVNRIDPIFIDEIGPVELQDRGFDRLLRKVIKTKTTLLITVRDACVNDVIDKYMIEKPVLINTYKDIDIKSIKSAISNSNTVRSI